MSGTANGPVLVINSGSSSLKYQLVVPDTAEVLASGLVEQIGEPIGRVTHTVGRAEPRRRRSPSPTTAPP